MVLSLPQLLPDPQARPQTSPANRFPAGHYSDVSCSQRSWGSGPGDPPFSAHSVRVLPTCRQEATPDLLPSALQGPPPSPHPLLAPPGTLCSGTGRQGYPSLPVGRDSGSLRGSCFSCCLAPGSTCGPLRASEQGVGAPGGSLSPASCFCWNQGMPTTPLRPQSADEAFYKLYFKYMF